MGGVSFFWGLGAGLNTILSFNHLFRVVSPDNLSAYQGTLLFLGNFFRQAVCDVIPRDYYFPVSLSL